MNSVAQMVSMMRNLLVDQQDEQVPYDAKVAYVEAGVDWLYDDLWVMTGTEVLLDDVVVTVVPPDDGVLVRVYLETDPTLQPTVWDGYEIHPAVGGGFALVVRDTTLTNAGYKAQFDWVVPYTIPATVTDPIDGLPAGGALAAVYYAMSLATVTPLDDRMDYTKYTTVSQNGVGVTEIVTVSAFWLERAEREKARVAKPHPPVMF